MLKYLLDEAAGAAGAAGETPAGGLGQWSTLIMLGVLLVVFYFLIIRPQKKQEKETNNMRNNLAVGDEITTIGGIIGVIISIKDETVTIATSRDNTKIRVRRDAIKSVDVHAVDAR